MSSQDDLKQRQARLIEHLHMLQRSGVVYLPGTAERVEHTIERVTRWDALIDEHVTTVEWHLAWSCEYAALEN